MKMRIVTHVSLCGIFSESEKNFARRSFFVRPGTLLAVTAPIIAGRTTGECFSHQVCCGIPNCIFIAITTGIYSCASAAVKETLFCTLAGMNMQL